MTTKPREAKKKPQRVCKHCKITDKSSVIYVLGDKLTGSEIERIHVCEDCFDTHCEICHEQSDIIYHRRKISDLSHKQICRFCYEQECNKIVEMDREYDIQTIDNTIKLIYE